MHAILQGHEASETVLLLNIVAKHESIGFWRLVPIDWCRLHCYYNRAMLPNWFPVGAELSSSHLKLAVYVGKFFVHTRAQLMEILDTAQPKPDVATLLQVTFCLQLHGDAIT